MRPSGYRANTGKYTTTKTTFSSIPVRTMKVGGNDTKSGGSIIIYATGDGDEYEAELVEGKSHGGGNLLSNDRRRNKVLEACANRRKKNRSVSRPSSAASLVASNKPTPEPDRAMSTNPFDDEVPSNESKHDEVMGTNPFDDEVPFDESRHDEVMGTNPFADDAPSAYPIAGRTVNPFD